MSYYSVFVKNLFRFPKQNMKLDLLLLRGKISLSVK